MTVHVHKEIRDADYENMAAITMVNSASGVRARETLPECCSASQSGEEKTWMTICAAQRDLFAFPLPWVLMLLLLSTISADASRCAPASVRSFFRPGSEM